MLPLNKPQFERRKLRPMVSELSVILCCFWSLVVCIVISSIKILKTNVSFAAACFHLRTTKTNRKRLNFFVPQRKGSALPSATTISPCNTSVNTFLKNIYFLSFIQVLNDLICLFDLIKEANIINDCAAKKRDRDRIKHIPICRWRMFRELPMDPYCQKNDSYGCHILPQKHKRERKSLQIIMDW